MLCSFQRESRTSPRVLAVEYHYALRSDMFPAGSRDCLSTQMDVVEPNLLWLHSDEILKTKLLLSASLACFLKPLAFKVF